MELERSSYPAELLASRMPLRSTRGSSCPSNPDLWVGSYARPRCLKVVLSRRILQYAAHGATRKRAYYRIHTENWPLREVTLGLLEGASPLFLRLGFMPSSQERSGHYSIEGTTTQAASI